MIPYFAWHNRGNHTMAVWLPAGVAAGTRTTQEERA